MKHNLQQLRSGKDFIHYASVHGAAIRNGKGSHTIITTQRGQAVVPHHTKDLGAGLRHKLVKVFIAIGLGAFALAIIACGGV